MPAAKGESAGTMRFCCSSNNSRTRKIVLTLVDLLHEFDSKEHPPRVVELLEAEHWLDPSFDASVVLLHDIVKVLTRTDLYRVMPTEVEFIAHAHPPQRRMRRFEAVERDRPG